VVSTATINPRVTARGYRYFTIQLRDVDDGAPGNPRARPRGRAPPGVCAGPRLACGAV